MNEIPALQHPVAAAADQASGPSPPTTASAARRLSRVKEKVIESLLFVAAFSSVAITLGIVGTLIYESSFFFAHVSLREFLTAPLWTPLFSDPRFGILPLGMGTLVTTAVALTVDLPVGHVAIYLSEFAPVTVREVIKPALELLSAVPTVVYGYFALQFMSPLLQKFIPGLPTFNMLSAGVVMGIMIIPYVSSLSEDAMRAVPMSLREGAYALGANRIITALKVVYPPRYPGSSLLTFWQSPAPLGDDDCRNRRRNAAN